MAVGGAKKTIAQWAMLPVLAFIGGLAGFVGGKYLKAAGPDLSISEWALLSLPIVAWVVIAWHELGHVSGGWLSGFRLVLFAVGPLKIERAHETLRLRYNISLQLWGGVAATAPQAGDVRTAAATTRAMFRIVAGGPIFSFLLGLLLIPAWMAIKTYPTAATLLGIGSVLSLAVGLATTIPSSLGGFHSDGSRLIQLIRGGEPAERWARIAILTGLSTTVRPREWPSELILLSTKAGDRSFDGVSAAWLRCAYHEDSGDLQQARFWIEEALAGEESWAKPLRPILHAAAAYVYATSGDVEAARRHLDQSRGPGLLSKDQLLHTEAAVLLAEGRGAEALAAARKALRIIPENAAGTAAVQREQLEKMIDEAGGKSGHESGLERGLFSD